MTRRRRCRRDRPDARAVWDDDRLIDELSTGAAVPGEPVAAALAAWRAEILAASARARAPGEVGGQPSPPRRTRRVSPVRLVASLAAGAALLAGVGLAAPRAEPGSPLWPITKAVFPTQAALSLAREHLEQARVAARDGRYGEAEQHLDQASALLDQLGDDPRARLLHAEVAALRETLGAPAVIVVPVRPGVGDTVAPAPRDRGPGGRPGTPIEPGRAREGSDRLRGGFDSAPTPPRRPELTPATRAGTPGMVRA